MTNKFVCVIYYKERKKGGNKVVSNGINPFNVWEILGYQAFDEQVIPVILDRLISNNIKRDFVKFISSTGKSNLRTQEGGGEILIAVNTLGLLKWD